MEGISTPTLLPEEAQKTLRSALAQGTYQNRVCIDQRPEVVDRRSRIGGWEADTLLGSRKKKQGARNPRGAQVPLLPYSRLRGQKSQFRLPGHTRGDCAHAQQLRDGDVR